MSNSDPTTHVSTVEVNCLSQSSEEAESLVVFELIVPGAAKVPASHQPLEVATILLRQGSITSTVPGKILTQLRANNTALRSDWCITATLAVPQPPRQPSRY
ncbi:hypothetical protein [Hymenobacter sp. IS2118]|uniref:hypothetical protein n=1 Tax=Hymenobacter sp. IS2118 TaxID=1505605 RepID=UPI00055460CB|nr:hypothetical protein [Hymenobacter sp. IS2118]